MINLESLGALQNKHEHSSVIIITNFYVCLYVCKHACVYVYMHILLIIIVIINQTHS